MQLYKEEKNMEKQWEAWTTPAGHACIQRADGEVITIKNDGITGYSFVLEYLKKMAMHYRSHLRAADLILQQQLGERYKHIKTLPELYNSSLAIISINCCFGEMDHVPDCDAQGNMHVEFVRCLFRATCPFNGYNPDLKDKQLVCCNPIYETSLTRRQAEMAELLAGTGYSVEELAAIMGVSYHRARDIASEIYATLGVNSRAELMLLLKEKRIR